MRKLAVWLSYADAEAPFAEELGAALDAAGARVAFAALGDQTVALTPRERYQLPSSDVFVLVAASANLNQLLDREERRLIESSPHQARWQPLIVVPRDPIQYPWPGSAEPWIVGTPGAEASQSAADLVAALALGNASPVPTAEAAPDQMRRTAIALLGQGRFTAAVAWARQATESTPADLVGWILLANTLIELRQYPEAQLAWERAAAISPQDAEVIYLSGVIAFRNGHLDDALAEARRGLAAAPNDLRLWGLLAHTYYQAQHAQEALEATEHGLLLAPMWVPLIQVRAQIFLQLKQFDAALAAINSALTLDPEDMGSMLLHVEILRQRDEVAEARAVLDVAYALEPENPQVWNAMSVQFQGEGRLDAALAAAERTTMLAPQEALYWLQRAFLLAQLERFAEAEDAIARARSLAPDLAIAAQLEAHIQQRLSQAMLIVPARPAAPGAPQTVSQALSVPGILIALVIAGLLLWLLILLTSNHS